MMMDADEFLAWAMPQRGLRWRGFRRNRRQVIRRLHGRIAELGLAGVTDYRGFLVDHPEEWTVLDGLCRVTISRFARDREIWTHLVDDILPRLARDTPRVTAWSAGCGAGEEPFTLAIAWTVEIAPRWPATTLDVLATDIDDVQLERARVGCFPSGALRELPDRWRRAGFEGSEREPCVRPALRASVRFARHDLRTPPPAGPFDLVLCRNLAFSYFDDLTQRSVAASVRDVMRTGGILVVGRDESLPANARGFAPVSHGIYVTVADSEVP